MATVSATTKVPSSVRSKNAPFSRHPNVESCSGMLSRSTVTTTHGAEEASSTKEACHLLVDVWYISNASSLLMLYCAGSQSPRRFALTLERRWRELPACGSGATTTVAARCHLVIEPSVTAAALARERRN